MITLTTSGNSIYFHFEDNPHYLQNGVIEAPKNSLILVTDDSQMATFKKVDGDVFLSALYSELGKSKSELETWFAENAVGSMGVDPEDVLDIVDENTNYIDGVDYVSSANTINFYHGEEIVDSIDTSDFVIDGMIDDVRIETISGVSYLVIDFNTASGKEDIQIPLTDIFNPDNYYTKQQVDAALSGKTDLSAFTAYTTYANQQIDGLTATTRALVTDTIPTMQNAIRTKADTSAVTADIAAAVSGKVDSSSLATVATSGDYDDLLNKPTIPTVPTDVSAFNNDAGYATSGYVDAAVSGKQDNAIEVTQAEYDALVSGGTVDPDTFYIITDAAPIDLSTYAQTSAVTAEIAAAVSGKVDSSSIVTAVTLASTDSEIPTAKAVYDAIPTGGTSITIDPSLDSGSTNPVANSAITNGINSRLLNVYYGDANYAGQGVKLLQKAVNSSSSTGWGYLSSINNKSIIDTDFTRVNKFSLVETSAITSAVTSASTDSQIPSAKAVYDAIGQGGGAVSSAITSGDTNAVAGGAVYDKFDEVEQVTARALNNLAEADEVAARALIDLNDKFDGLKLKKISQSDYNALTIKDSNTLYIIVN